MPVTKSSDTASFGKIKTSSFLKYIKTDVTYRMSKLDEECWRGMPSKLELLISWRTFGRFMLAMIALLMETNYSKYKMLPG